ncbi:MAG: cryptochrome/photolyase family protein [Planctomycetota bacterium]
MSEADDKTLFVVLGNQLFPFRVFKPYRAAAFFMAEDVGLCTYVKHHQQKILLFLSAMRSHADELRGQDCAVHYERLEDQTEAEGGEAYEAKLERFCAGRDFDRLVMFEIEDKFFEERIETFAAERGLALTFLESPMFVTSREQFAEYRDESAGRLRMAGFYERQRRRLGVLVEGDGSPVGGQWSFDQENRKKLPKSVEVPTTPGAAETEHVEALRAVVRERFGGHPGELPEEGAFWWPTTRRQALWWLREFLEVRFSRFGPYEDALSGRDDVLFHSVLSPMLNLGLLLPDEVVERALVHAREDDTVEINSLEGFVRQVIGWREFVRGVYREYSGEQSNKNFWGHRRKLKVCWYDGTTGMRPLDEAIDKARRLGWTHHIERLMVLANLMNLCEVEPGEAHRWFMEMFVDSSDWVMGPNVYGMGLMSDGGLFATKPYICGSNYLVKMSDGYKKSEGWCEVLDGLYWRFVNKHRGFFAGNARLSMMLGTLEKMGSERKERIFKKAEDFIVGVTRG